MTDVRFSELRDNAALVSDEMERDPAFRAEWERTALARAVATAVVRYRGTHQMSQRDLARLIGMSQPQVARIELGETNPSMETLMRLSSKLQIEFTIDIRPAGHPARNVTKRALASDLVGEALGAETVLLIAAN